MILNIKSVQGLVVSEGGDFPQVDQEIPTQNMMKY
jgi:hypothetical protein